MDSKSIARPDHVSIEIPRSALTIVERPRTASQRTSERVFGLPKRHYLDLLPLYRGEGGQVMDVGKLRVVDVDAFVGWLSRRAALQPAKTAPANDGLSDLERELGLVVSQ